MPEYFFRNKGKTLLDLADKVRLAGKLFLFLDYDGTIVPIRKTPHHAILLPRTKKLLRTLSSQPRVVVGIVSGRSLADLRRMVGLKGLILAANHGFEIQSSRTWIHPYARTVRPLLESLAIVLQEGVRKIPGALVQDKGSTITVHYRNVSRRNVRDVMELVSVCARPLSDTIQMTQGKKVIELRPNVPWNKGYAVRQILRDSASSRNRMILYCGDDRTDEDAFRLLPRTAVTICVGTNSRSLARFSVRSVQEVHTVLNTVLTALRS